MFSHTRGGQALHAVQYNIYIVKFHGGQTSSKGGGGGGGGVECPAPLNETLVVSLLLALTVFKYCVSALSTSCIHVSLLLVLTVFKCVSALSTYCLQMCLCS